MAIVRELLIRLGFQTDKKAINETNQAITGFKTRFAVAATAATYAFSRVAQFFNDVTSATLDAAELAQYLGVSVNELKALTQAGQEFRLGDAQFGSVLAKLNKDLRDLQQGFGDLREISLRTGLEFDPFAGSAAAFDTIIKYLRTFGNELDRQKVAADIFGDSLAVKISNIARDYESFTEAVRKNNEALRDMPDNTEEFRSYERSVQQISNSFYALARTIINEIAPAIEMLAKWLEIVVKLYTNLFTLNFSGFKSAASQGWDFLSGNLDRLQNTIREKFGKIEEYFRPYVEVQPLQGASASVLGADPYAGFNDTVNRWFPSVTNSFEVNVPVGTTEEQTQYMGTELQRMVEDSIMNTFYQIQNNNPQVE